MQRDMELIRQVLLAAECGPPYPKPVGYSDAAVKYHQMLAIEAGLLHGKHLKYMSEVTEIPSVVLVQGVTWEGHNFIDAVRENDSWSKIKTYLAEKGKQLSIESIMVAAKIIFGFASS